MARNALFDASNSLNARDYLLSFSLAILAPLIRFEIFWNAISLAKSGLPCLGFTSIEKGEKPTDHQHELQKGHVVTYRSHLSLLADPAECISRLPGSVHRFLLASQRLATAD